MACFRPIPAYRRPGGGVAFNSRDGFVDRPLELKCGKCVGCRRDRARDWAVRCVHEAAMHERNSFVTLTYSDEHLPGDYGLDVGDWQKFAKRLRKRMGPFRFFHCGEYGERGSRPHYHALIFGHDFRDGARIIQREPHSLWSSERLDEVWGLGRVTVGAVNVATASYVAQYCMKKLGTSEYGGRKPPYVTMSRRPGLGAGWYEKYAGDVFPSDEVIVEGQRFTPPRFYVEKLSDADQQEMKRNRAASVNREHTTPERLAVREECAKARMGSRSAV